MNESFQLKEEGNDEESGKEILQNVTVLSKYECKRGDTLRIKFRDRPGVISELEGPYVIDHIYHYPNKNGVQSEIYISYGYTEVTLSSIIKVIKYRKHTKN